MQQMKVTKGKKAPVHRKNGAVTKPSKLSTHKTTTKTTNTTTNKKRSTTKKKDTATKPPPSPESFNYEDISSYVIDVAEKRKTPKDDSYLAQGALNHPLSHEQKMVSVYEDFVSCLKKRGTKWTQMVEFIERRGQRVHQLTKVGETPYRTSTQF